MADILADGHYHGYRTMVVAYMGEVMGPRLVDLVGTSDNTEVSDAVASIRLVSDSDLVPWDDISDDDDCDNYDDYNDLMEYDGCADYGNPSECPGCVDCM